MFYTPRISIYCVYGIYGFFFKLLNYFVKVISVPVFTSPAGGAVVSCFQFIFCGIPDHVDV